MDNIGILNQSDYCLKSETLLFYKLIKSPL